MGGFFPIPSLQATYPAGGPVAAVFWPNAGLSAGALSRRENRKTCDAVLQRSRIGNSTY
jgi:hypothetical protein